MPITVKVVTEEEYKKWLIEAKQKFAKEIIEKDFKIAKKIAKVEIKIMSTITADTIIIHQQVGKDGPIQQIIKISVLCI